MGMDYSRIRDWVVREDSFDPEALGKCESIMSLGNGYLGVRSTTEEHYRNEVRGMYVAGTFNKFDENEVTELPNAADLVAVDLFFDGERFLLDRGSIKNYSRELNIKTGELVRSTVWISPKQKTVSLTFERIVSLARMHTIAQRITLTPQQDTTVKLLSGIDGTMTNTGSQHFSDGEKRFYDKKYIQFVQVTSQSHIPFVETVTHVLKMNGDQLHQDAEIFMDRRKVYGGYQVEVKAGQTLTIEKYSNVYTGRDREMESMDIAGIQEVSLAACKKDAQDGYGTLAAESAEEWNKEVWEKAPIQIEGCDMDAFAVRFAQYHLRMMVPSHDNRMNIGAKGLSGEGYKGHTFWDTEIFLLPYYIFTDPCTARKLEEYRYLSLPSAHAKAAHNHYQGAMFPWESAWLDDGEVTPEFCDVDIVTGKPVKVWSGFIEQHITSDVAFGAWQYAVITGDEDFLEKYGYELIMDTAIFWASRLEQGEDGKYHINDVVGPDEFREHVNDNAFTNYMAHWNMAKAMEYCDRLKENNPGLYAALNEKLGLEDAYRSWADGVQNLYLPQPTGENVLPQDDRYLSCRDIDLTKYKEQEHVGGITRDYNLEQINQIQVSKQADCLVLFFLLENEFPPEVKKASWEYYEKRTIHDSSLSLSTHAVLACDMGEKKMAYDLFRKASMIDLGPFMGSSNAGIHAASFGGVWECVVYGFGGVRMLDGKLRIRPLLTDAWEKLFYTIMWKGQKLAVEVMAHEVKITNLTGSTPVVLEVNDAPYTLEKELIVTY